jgi:uncharacterized protein YndB with AHSA1/START domain
MESIRITGIIPASPDRVYEAWLNSDEHSKFTSSVCEVDPEVGGAHSAYDGYISGKILELDPSNRIVQSWRTQQFKEGDPDSRLEVVPRAATTARRVSPSTTPGSPTARAPCMSRAGSIIT